ncbi:hypothetical protein C2W59_02755 [Bacillus pumilus]|uniref:Uncharacterized protein n=1 Tax=Bacillus pumilus TaxID=1408 RepID=A0AB34QSU6_BACPU|nr:hypothetical protein B4127_3178 [Bacillus pumilus]RAP12654.1 hypothetical protein C2W58_02992 [Bacillus pumilus]RAP23176.1 hypothetical protein C2W59_02755 [Bacillus pumilus]
MYSMPHLHPRHSFSLFSSYLYYDKFLFPKIQSIKDIR